MEDRCTCGAILVADARFCHKCGRPLREEVVPPDEDENAPEPVQVQPQTVRIELPPDAPPAGLQVSLFNGLTLRASLVGAAVQFLATIILGMVAGVLAQIAPIFAGVTACVIFQRRARTQLGVVQGARLGWITGVVCFLMVTILLAVTLALANNESVMAEVRAAASSSQMQKEALTAMEKLREDPKNLLMVLPFQFLLLTLLGSIGGALGAKLTQR